MEAVLDRTLDVTATKQKPDRRLHVSTLYIVLVAMTLLAFLFTFTLTKAWGERMDQLAALSSTDAFKTMDLETLDGTHFTSENLKDARITIFNVWGTNCPPCIRELPYLQELNDTYAPGEIQVVGLLSDSVDASGTVVPAHLDDARKYMAHTPGRTTSALPGRRCLNSWMRRNKKAICHICLLSLRFFILIPSFLLFSISH